MLQRAWSRFVRRRRAEATERDVERDRLRGADRRFAEESVDDLQAEEFVKGHLGGVDPERLIEDDRPQP